MKRNRARERGFTEESGQWYSNGNHIQQLILFNGRPSFQRPIDLTYGSGSARRSELLHRFFNWNNNGSIRLMAHVYAHRREMETTKSSDSALKLIELLLFTPLYSALLCSTPLYSALPPPCRRSSYPATVKALEESSFILHSIDISCIQWWWRRSLIRRCYHRHQVPDTFHATNDATNIWRPSFLNRLIGH